MIEPQHKTISVARQCELVGLSRSAYYYQPQTADALTLTLLRLIDEEYTRHPFLGTRKMVTYLQELGYSINRKRVQRLYGLLGIEAVFPKPNPSKPDKQHKVFPYLLRGVAITHCNQVWSADITYLRLHQGFVYLVAVMDWFSRYVLDWGISTSLEADFCIEVLQRVLSTSHCGIFNTDQGSQFTAQAFTNTLLEHDVKVSMDGRGRALDNVFIERLWRSVKYECIYLKEFTAVNDIVLALQEYFEYYNYQRPHQALNYQTPAKIYTQQ